MLTTIAAQLTMVLTVEYVAFGLVVLPSRIVRPAIRAGQAEFKGIG